MFGTPFHPQATPTAIAACLAAIGEGAAVQLFPAGTFDAPRGAMAGRGPWKMDESIARRVIEKAAARRNDILIDYEHQTLLSARNGQPAPAAGWLSPESLQWRGDGLYAVDPRWTERAAAAIAAGEYRYLSPVFRYDPKTGEVLELLHVALTNNPAIDGMAELAAATAESFQPEEPSPMFEAILKALGLQPDATEEEALAALTALQDRVTELEAQAETAAASGNPDPARFAPVEALHDLQSQVAALTAQVREREVDDLIAAARENGKLTSALEPWARELGRKDLDELKRYLDQAAPIAALAGTQTGGRAPAQETKPELTDEELAVCRQFEIDPDEYLKTKEEVAA